MKMIWIERLSRYGLSKTIVATLFILSLLSIVMQMVGLGIFIPIFEYIFSGDNYIDNNSSIDFVKYIINFVEYIGLNKSIESLLLGSFLFYFISQILNFLIAYINVYYFGKMTKDMRNNFLAFYLNADSEYYDRVKISDVVNITFSELGNAIGGVLAPIKLMVVIISSVGSAAVLFLISYELTLYSILMSAIALIYPAFLISKTTVAGRENTVHNALLTSFLVDRLRSPRLVRLCGTAQAEIKEYDRITEKQRKLTLYIQLLKEKIGLVFEPMVIFSTLVMLYVSTTYLDMDSSSVFVFMIIMVRLVPIIRKILNLKQTINRTKGPIEAIDNILNEMEESSASNNKINSNIGGRDSLLKIDKLEIAGVFYRYSEKLPFVLSNISLSFSHSTINAVVGPSGGGKSTLIDIISGYRVPTNGSVLLDGKPLNGMIHNNISDILSYVPQQPQIFDGRVDEHILYGSKAKTNNVLQASKLAGAHNFIKEFKHGYKTILNDNGSNLSGGQRFRLDFARALLSDAPLLILDEPTGALDYVSKNLFIKSIKEIKRHTNKIIIIITHDLSIHELFDSIIVIENGIASSDKTHDLLIKNNKWYKTGCSNIHKTHAND